MNPEDQKLSALLKGAKPSPSLPPRFRENVWRRIEHTPARQPNWLDALAAMVLRPRIAWATALVLLVSGMLLGVHQGGQAARQADLTRYLAAVAPQSWR
jgi:hypothetical protein